MDVVIIYESLTGNTKRAAGLIADAFFREHVGTKLFPRDAVDPEAVAAADLVIVGTWTDGFVFIGQRPGRKAKLLKTLPDLTGKRCAVFCTYAVNPGHTLTKLSKVVESHGGDVLGGMAMHRKDLDATAAEFAERILDVVAA